MGAQIVNSLGGIYITDDVIATLAGVTAVKCYGIVGMASKRAKDGLVELLGGENITRGVKISTEDNEIIIELFIIVEYGISINIVAQNVVDTVRYNVELLTGIKVKKVNIKVEGVRVSFDQ